MKPFILFFSLSILLMSCSNINDAGKVLRNEKIRTTDEFLVEKKNPLVLPPNYEEIPKPGTILGKQKNSEEKIKNILKAPKVENSKTKPSSSVEESILNRIRK